MDPDTANAPRRSLLRAPSAAGIIGAAVFWAASLTPTLLPRTWSSQAAISATSAAVGYGVAVGIAALGRAVLHRPAGTPAAEESGRIPGWVWPAVSAAILLGGALLWWRWQNSQRELVDMPALAPVTTVPLLAATAVLTTVFVLVGRGVGRAVAGLDHVLARRLARPAAHLLTAAIVAFVVIGGGRLLISDAFMGWLNDRYSTVNEETPEGVRRPTNEYVSGGSDSAVAWGTLGYYGRQFVAEATSPAAIGRFDRRIGAAADAAAVHPVRVYAGLDSAPTAERRAELVVEDLRRTGGFDRGVLAVATTTGTGWVDPDSARALEYLWHGDTAIAATQYSYLPSWISFLMDRDEAEEEGRTLYEVVHRAWSELPADDRPELLVFGESLGSFGSEFALLGDDAEESADNAVEGSDAVLWAGPTNDNPLWRQFQAERAPRSPTWLPVYDRGDTVRWSPEPGWIAPETAWRGTRVLYLEHGSDPVGRFNFQTLWAPQPWMDRPTAPDVPERVIWFPVVSFVQVVADLIAGFSAPAGHGHNYDNGFVAGWATVAPPPGWTEADTAALEDHLHG